MGNWKLRFKSWWQSRVARGKVSGDGSARRQNLSVVTGPDFAKHALHLFFCFFLVGCGNISTNTNPPPPTPDEATTTTSYALILGANFTDITGTLNLLTLNTPRTPTRNLQTTHSDALVRVFNNKIYVVNRLGGDNIQIVDPANFRVTLQCSTGQATNPQDIVVVSPTQAYVTLYSPGNNRTPGLTVSDLLIVNPSATSCDTFIVNSLDLTSFTANDGNRYARASSLLLIGDRLFIAVQDLPQNLALAADQPGKIVVLDTRTNTFLGSIVLSGRDPIAMTYSSQTGMIYVADADFFNLQSSYGGIEVVNPNSLSTQGVVVDDLTLGGAVGDIETIGTSGFVTVGFQGRNAQSFSTKVTRFRLDGTGTPTDIYSGRSYIQDIATDPNGKLFIGDRDPLVNGIVVMDPTTQNVVDGPINTGAAPSSIAFLSRAGTTSASATPPRTDSPTSPSADAPLQGLREIPPPTPQAPYADRVVSYTRGENGGFNEEQLPQIVLGPPKGLGLLRGSTDVVSLGHGGEIILEFTDYTIVNGEGPDFTVFENTFYQDGDPNLVYAEPASVAVSEDGVHFTEFPCNSMVRPYLGCAGTHPVYANPPAHPPILSPDENNISPTDPVVSGGDSFDLAQINMRSARFVRIRDANARPLPIGPMKGGFDLDAVVVIHGTTPP